MYGNFDRCATVNFSGDFQGGIGLSMEISPLMKYQGTYCYWGDTNILFDFEVRSFYNLNIPPTHDQLALADLRIMQMNSNNVFLNEPFSTTPKTEKVEGKLEPFAVKESAR